MPDNRHRPRKRFGQHFLAPAWADKLVVAIAPRADETILEIGPGEGALTRPLAAGAGRIIAVEIDRDLAAAWRDSPLPNVDVIEGDFLTLDEAALARHLGGGPTRVAGNLPYNVAAPILFRLVDAAPRLHLTEATVMVQREVADRLLAAPGSRDYGVLTVLIGHRASIERVFVLPPGAFRPPPKVHSAVVRLRFHEPLPPAVDESLFERVVQAAFTRRRKTVSNALLALAPGVEAQSSSLADVIAKSLVDTGLAGNRRPETLTIAEWVALADALGRHVTRQR